MSDEVGGIQATVGMDDSGLTPALARMKAALQATHKELMDLHAGYMLADSSGQAMTGQVEQLAAKAMQLKAQIDASTVAIARQAATAGLNTREIFANATAIQRLSTSTAGVEKGASGAGRGMLLFSQGVEDAQYGLNAVLNNIPGVLMAFGAGAGLAGTVSMAAVAINLLTKGMGDLVDIFVVTPFKSETQRLEELSKATRLTADETARLTKLKREDREFDTLKGQQGKEEKAQAKAMQTAFADSDGELLARGLRAGVKAEADKALEPDAKQRQFIEQNESMERIAKAAPASGWMLTLVGKMFGFRGSDDARRRMGGNAEDRQEAAVKRIVENSQNDLGPAGDIAREDLGRLVAKNPKAFRPGLLGDVERATPAARKQQKEWEDQGEEYERKFQERVKAGTDPATLARQHRADEAQGAKYEREYVKRKRDEAAGQAVGALQGRFDESMSSGHDATAEQIAEEIAAAGLKNIGDMENHVLEKLKQNYKEALARRAAERGITPEAAASEIAVEAALRRRSQVHEAARVRDDPMGAKARERQRVRDGDEIAADEALDRLPGLGTAAEREYIKQLGATGFNPDKARGAVRDRMEKMFQAQGMPALQATLRADQMSRDVARGVNEDIAERAMAGPPVRNSSVMDASQLNASIQASITNENPSLKVQERMLDRLGEIKGWMDRFGNGGQPVK